MTNATPPLTIPELERLLRAANPGVILLPPRLLRRVIKEDRDIGGLGLQVPHGWAYTIGRERLLHLVPREALGLEAEHHLPATVLLLARPDVEGGSCLEGLASPTRRQRHLAFQDNAPVLLLAGVLETRALRAGLG